jgi:hypothetical protein
MVLNINGFCCQLSSRGAGLWSTAHPRCGRVNPKLNPQFAVGFFMLIPLRIVERVAGQQQSKRRGSVQAGDLEDSATMSV